MDNVLRKPVTRRLFMGSMAALAAANGRGLLFAEASSSHPRLYLDAKRLARLRQDIQTTHAPQWKLIQRDADRIADSEPPKYNESNEIDGWQQLWQRTVGDNLSFLAMAWAVAQDRRYLDAATRWSLASCGYPHWGVGRPRRDGLSDSDLDLAAGHQLFGLALVYDWAYSDLAADTRETIRRTLLERGRRMYEGVTGVAYWKNSYLQNHLWVNITGLAAAGLALDNEPETKQWLDLIRDKYRRTEAALGSDGASHEGAGYWVYGVDYMLRYWQLSADFFGESPTSEWWQHTADYRLYVSLPRNSWAQGNTIVNFGDCPNADWSGPEYLLRRLAVMNRDPHAQWLAAEIENLGRKNSPAAPWLNLLWYDPAIASKSPAGLPTLRHFEDLGLVSARSDWSGDESLVAFKCGPPLGHEAVKKFDSDPGCGHVHPDVNHFVVFGHGEWLIRDDGYAWKETDHHNTLLVDGIGQLGDNVIWFNGNETIKAKADPRILRVSSTPELDEIAGDAASIYRREAGVKRFIRRLYYLKPDVLIVVDDIEVDKPRALELRFHPQAACTQAPDGAFVARGQKAALRLEALTRDGVEASAGETPGWDRDHKPMSLHAVRLQSHRAAWKNAVAISWSAAGVEPERVTLDAKADRWIFRAGKRKVEVKL